MQNLKRMKKLAIWVIGLCLLPVGRVLAAETPRGSLLELHSCELYAGGCVVSSEATLGGRYMLRVWNFTGGSYAGADFTGLQLAVIQSSAENLAAERTLADQAVAYLPQNATPSQRKSLLAWVKSTQSDLKRATFRIRVAPLQFEKTASGYAFTAGDFVSVKTASLESCDMGGCGESLWYAPRSPTSVFTVAVNRSSHVTEPLLSLTWDDAGKRSIFLAKFGGANPAKNLYVTTADLCGPAARLF
jgi:hypothetical protein